MTHIAETQAYVALDPLTELESHYCEGTLIADKYRLEVELGAGGMGTVWRARNITLDAPVAIKLIRPDMQREETLKRLLLEAQLEAKLKHPNLVRVFDFGQTAHGHSYIVMEYLEGISLGTLMDQRPRLEPVEAVQLILPVVGALCYTHENGVVHRDLKPDNIFLDRVGLQTTPKLLDFGIAKWISDSAPLFAERGTVLGSPAYMAPEQAKGSEHVDHRADIWSICVVLYEAISGGAAFPGEGYAALRAVVEDELRPLENTGAGEGALWLVLKRGLQKDPACRYQSMLELGNALAQWLSDRGESEDVDGNRIARSWSLSEKQAREHEPYHELALVVPEAERLHERAQRELDVADFGLRATLLGVRHPTRGRTRASAAVVAVSLAAAVAIVFMPGNTLPHEPAGVDDSHIVQPAEPQAMLADITLASHAAPPGSARLAPPPAPAFTSQLSQTPDELIQHGVATPGPKHMQKQTPEAELGLKAPY